MFASQTDEPNIFGNTALHMACHTGQDLVATELLNCGANINQPNSRGDTPLHLAAASSSGALCLELLVNNGADVNVQVLFLLNRVEKDMQQENEIQSIFWIVRIVMVCRSIINLLTLV